MDRYVLLALIGMIALVASVSAESEYCAPPSNFTTIVDHNGDWWNITIYTPECTYCIDNGGGTGDLDCYPCSVAAPIVKFTSNVTCGIVPFDVQFTDNSIGVNITDYYWDFGDGFTSTDKNPVHNYTVVNSYSINHSATNYYGTNWKNVSYYMNARPLGDTCAPPPTGVVISSGERPIAVPLPTGNFYLPFLIAPFICLLYLFRRVAEEEEGNAIWGDVIAAGTGLVVCGIVIIWFATGGIASESVTVENTTYVLPSNMSMAQAVALQGNLSQPVYNIGEHGSGVFIKTAMSEAVFSSTTTVTVHTYDIVNQQYTDYGLAFFYMLLFGVFLIMFIWSVNEGRNQLKEREYHEEYGMEKYGG